MGAGVMGVVNGFYFCSLFIFVYAGYPPTGDEVQAGSVLLPASRRGRYLANIVRRQAVDGTGIKFNKDADRMNAEAKKKVDVLSEELLPYIIAEQERRTTLYKRVMTAIQNGEKGVTVAEIRNKPPLIIRKGLMYRCPANRAPKEPDGSGVIMCEEDIEPTPVMYDSCLSAEDKELYIAESKYFFCNRHKVEGPDLPRNGSTVIGCAPLERTSLNYTSQRCALEDSDDVVVHYRYYPDRTYKFVTELDPDREVCDHWNPCQIGYIYSLPSTDQAMPANELWHDYEEKPDEYERDEIVPAIPEDSADEYVTVGQPYTTNLRKITIPEGFKFHGLGRWEQPGAMRRQASMGDSIRIRLTAGDDDKVVANVTNIVVTHSVSGRQLSITIAFEPFTRRDSSSYYVRLQNTQTQAYKFLENVLTMHPTSTQLTAQTVNSLPGIMMNKTIIYLSCGACKLLGLTVRGADGGVTNLDKSKYKLKTFMDQMGKEQKYVEVDLDETHAADFGDYFVNIQNEDGQEEKILALSLKRIKLQRIEASLLPGAHYDAAVTWECDDCTLTDVVCNGETMLSTGRVTVVPGNKQVSFNFPSFEDENACMYTGLFKDGKENIYRKEVALIQNDSPDVTLPKSAVKISAPVNGEPFDQQIPYTCTGDCSVQKMSVNGIPLDQEVNSRRFFDVQPQVQGGRRCMFFVANMIIFIRIPIFSLLYAGAYLATFGTKDGPVTKEVMEISCDDNPPASGGGDGSGGGSESSAPEGDTTPAGESGGCEKEGRDPLLCLLVGLVSKNAKSDSGADESGAVSSAPGSDGKAEDSAGATSGGEGVSSGGEESASAGGDSASEGGGSGAEGSTPAAEGGEPPAEGGEPPAEAPAEAPAEEAPAEGRAGPPEMGATTEKLTKKLDDSEKNDKKGDKKTGKEEKKVVKDDKKNVKKPKPKA